MHPSRSDATWVFFCSKRDYEIIQWGKDQTIKMSVLDNIRAFFTGDTERRGITPSIPVTMYTPPDRLEPERAMGLSTVFACVDVISSAIAKLPIIPYKVDKRDTTRVRAAQDDLYYMLNFTPNDNQTRFDFIKALVISTLLEGNGYARVKRNEHTGYGAELELWNAHDVTILLDKDATKVVGYYNARLDAQVPSGDVVHVRNFSDDGIKGVSTLTYARSSLSLANKVEQEVSNYYNTGGGSFGILTSEKSRLNDKQREDIRKEWNDNFQMSSAGLTGLAILETGMQYQKITINPADAQLLQTRAFSVPEICRFFNVSPVKVHDLTKSSYSTVEAVDLAFLTDTLSPYLTKIELELWRKVLPRNARKSYRIEFDTSAFRRGDTDSQVNLYRSLATIGAVTPNEVRENFGFGKIDGGDDAYIQVNMTKLKDLEHKSNEQRNGETIGSDGTDDTAEE